LEYIKLEKTEFEEVKQFLEEHDYIVKVFGIDEYSCKAIFPASGQQPSYQVTYKYELAPTAFEPGNIYVIIGDGKTIFPVIESAYRLGIYLNIIDRMVKMNMDKRLINYYRSDGNKVEGLSDLLKEPTDIKKELELAKIAANVIKHKRIEDTV
jgi:hypothetical protein